MVKTMMEKNPNILCKKCQISFHINEIDEIGLCAECRKNQGTSIGKDGRKRYKMRYSIIGVLRLADRAEGILSSEEIINLFTWTCRKCKNEEEMWKSMRCRQCCFWDKPDSEDRPTHFIPK